MRISKIFYLTFHANSQHMFYLCSVEYPIETRNYECQTSYVFSLDGKK
jgi:hypothetical protein